MEGRALQRGRRAAKVDGGQPAELKGARHPSTQHLTPHLRAEACSAEPGPRQEPEQEGEAAEGQGCGQRMEAEREKAGLCQILAA